MQKRSPLPPPPILRPTQRYSGRFWDTIDMMELLSIYHGATHEAYPQTWQYRTLIAVYRAQSTHNAFRKGYGPDWKAEIKPDLLEYKWQGRLPFDSLKLAAAEIRKVEQELWVKARVERGMSKQKLILAAE